MRTTATIYEKALDYFDNLKNARTALMQRPKISKELMECQFTKPTNLMLQIKWLSNFQRVWKR